MKESFELKTTFKVKPGIIYHAWLTSKEHSGMTGSRAVCSDVVGEEFSAWDGYIRGKNLQLTPDLEIVQSWRTAEFDDEDEDSRLIIRLREIDSGTELSLFHSNIPKGQTAYKQGWTDHYFLPMREYFESNKGQRRL